MKRSVAILVIYLACLTGDAHSQMMFDASKADIANAEGTSWLSDLAINDVAKARSPIFCVKNDVLHVLDFRLPKDLGSDAIFKITMRPAKSVTVDVDPSDAFKFGLLLTEKRDCSFFTELSRWPTVAFPVLSISGETSFKALLARAYPPPKSK